MKSNKEGGRGGGGGKGIQFPSNILYLLKRSRLSFQAEMITEQIKQQLFQPWFL